MFLIQYDSRRKGDAGKLAEFQCFLSLLICQIFSYKSVSLKLFIPSSKEVSRVPLVCSFFMCGLTLVDGFSLVIFGFGVCENVRL